MVSHHGWESLMVRHPAKFGGHRHCGSGDVFSGWWARLHMLSLKSAITGYH